MEITWFGHTCFRLSERGLASVVTDPYDHEAAGYLPLRLNADVVTISHESPATAHKEAVSNKRLVINGPGEYEIGGVFITGVRPDGHNADEITGRNTLYVFEYNGLNVAHLGILNRVPNQAEVEALGPVHVALVPVGGGKGLSAGKAVEVVSLLEPNIVIPMHYGTLAAKEGLEPIGKFLKEMGLGDVERLSQLKISGTGSLPSETRVVVLDYPHTSQE
jgi:L-ascorbate metabolism protein UlaG (beta-lactamase superfamily)